MIRIAIDAMGGDNAPEEIIKGALSSIKDLPGVSLILVGQKDRIAPFVRSCDIEIVHAAEIIGMHEAPVAAVKQKKNSSIAVALDLIKNKKADALISAGNTGALMAASLFKLGRIEGIERPAIATIFPNLGGKGTLLLDMGANVDCKPKHLEQFALMGSCYAEHAMHKKSPKVGLLNIGTELEKGNELVQQTYPLLSNSNINFVGYVESADVFSGKVDVVVCDGFVGNIVLKLAESTSNVIFTLLKEELKKSVVSKAAALVLRPAFKRLLKRTDYDEYGAAPLLGLNAVVFKAHGRAKAKAISSAVRVCADAVKENIVESIAKNL